MKRGSILKLILFCAFACAMIGAHSLRAQPASPPWRELDPKLIGPTDPDYTARFHIGRLIFRIPNRFLVFPWPNGQQPFDPAVCENPDRSKESVTRSVCSSPSQSVFLKIPVPRHSGNEQNAVFVSAVTLGYGLGYIFSHYSVEQFEAGPYEADHFAFGIRSRVHELDTRGYAAFRAGDYIYVKKSESDTFRLITCTSKNFSANSLEDLDCAARMSLLGDKFPQTPDSKSGYTIEFELPGAELDNVSHVGASVTKAVSGFLEASPAGQ
jgi:hypothetical protein